MAITNTKYGTPIGLDNLHCAKLTLDEKDTVPVYTDLNPLRAARVVNATLNNEKKQEWFDDMPMYNFNAKGAKNLTITRASLSNEEKQLYLGYGKTTLGYTVDGSTDTPPYVAIGYRVRKRGVDGVDYFDYVWHLKGTLSEDNSNAESRQESISPQLRNLSGDFIARMCDGEYTIIQSTDDPNLTQQQLEDLETDFFTLATLNTLIVRDLT
jgi:phi13 family phage major tail protein